MPKEPKKRPPLSRDHWLKLALETLSEQGRSKFSLDALIGAMPVGKGSFYHHFRNREEFLLALVEFWDRRETQNVIDAMEALPKSLPAEARLWELMCVVYETQSTRHELLIRALTLEFPQVRDAVELVDRKRITTVRQIFSDLGWEGDDLEARTLSFVATTSFDRLILCETSREDYERQLRSRYDFFMGGA